jgi:hypothetical protein
MLDEMSSPSAPIAGSPETFRLRCGAELSHILLLLLLLLLRLPIHTRFIVRD